MPYATIINLRASSSINLRAGQSRRAAALFGKIFTVGPGTLEWNGGILFGLTASVPTITARWQLEYEIHYWSLVLARGAGRIACRIERFRRRAI